MLIIKRSFFTLLEMLVVLLLLSTGVALTGVKIKQAYDEQRKLSDIQHVLNCLTMAQDLMLMMDVDIEVVFSHDPKSKNVVCRLEVEKPLNETWTRLVERKIPLSMIRSFNFSGQHGDPLRLRFTLGKMSQGILTLSTDDHVSYGFSNKDDFRIFLAGYPESIEQVGEEYRMDENLRENEQLFPVEIYTDIFKDANEKV